MAQAEPVNLVLGKPATFNTKPVYSLTTDPNDAVQLTDGKHAGTGPEQVGMWGEKGTVGWTNKSPVVISFDLGSVQAISGVSFNTAAGRAGVNWPLAIYNCGE